ncbi:6179_t:CDS:2, partial [Scutellospora calospora]
SSQFWVSLSRPVKADDKTTYLCNVATDARARAPYDFGRSGISDSLSFNHLPLGDFLPSLRAEFVGVLAPDFLAVVHGVSRHAQHGAVDAKGFLDAHVEFLDARRVHEHVEEQGAGGVGGGVGAGDQLGEGLGGEFGAAEFLTLLVFAFHEAGEEVDTVDLASLGGLEAHVDTGNGDTGEVLDGFNALGEEWVHEVLGVWLDPGNAANGVGDLTSAVEHFNGWSIGWWSVGGCPDFCEILSILEHTEGSAERQISNDVERNVVEPVQAVHAVESAAGLLAELVPLCRQHLKVVVHVLFELADALGAECVRNGLALADHAGWRRRHRSSPCSMMISLRRESLEDIDIRFKETSSMAIDYGDRIRVCDRDLVRLDADEFAVLRVGIVDSQITAAAATLVQVPEVGELGEEWTGDILVGTGTWWSSGRPKQEGALESEVNWYFGSWERAPLTTFGGAPVVFTPLCRHRAPMNLTCPRPIRAVSKRATPLMFPKLGGRIRAAVSATEPQVAELFH